MTTATQSDKNLFMHQVVALVSSRSKTGAVALTKVHQKMDKKTTEGERRIPKPLQDGDPEAPAPEIKRVQTTVSKELKEMLETVNPWINVALAQERGNQTAKANLVVGSNTLLENVPVSGLLFLSHRLNEFKTLIEGLPTLNPALDWKFDQSIGQYVTDPERSNYTKKTAKVITKYEATDKHPAQTEIFHEDSVRGHWEKVYQSGAVSETAKSEMLKRVALLIEAVELAREQANSVKTDLIDEAHKITDWLFDPAVNPQ